jgi:hypothetical protein
VADPNRAGIAGNRGHIGTMAPKRPRDPNALGKLIVDLATGGAMEIDPDAGKNQAAAALGRKGGEARAKAISKERRAEIAKAAARKRWAGSQGKP